MSQSSGVAKKKPMLGDRSYETLKKSATLVLPAIGTLYFTLAQIWQLPKAEEVVGSIAAINTFVGVLVSISTKSYNKLGKYSGEIKIEDEGNKKKFSLELDGDPEDLEKKQEVTFKITDTGGHPVYRG